MKKILVATNILLIGIILFMGCNQNSSSPTPNIAPTVNNCSTLTCKGYEGIEPYGAVSSAVIKKLSEAYADDAYKAKIRGTQDPDALSLTFNLEEIKNLVWHIDQAVCNSGCKKQIGIKFYYIKYDDKILQQLPPDMREVIIANPNKHSLVMVPAYLSGDKWYDFDYKHLTSKCNFIPIADSIIGVMNLSGNNHGGIGPPPERGTFPTIE